VIIYGINPVMEALRAGRVTGLRVTADAASDGATRRNTKGRGGTRRDDRVQQLLTIAEEQGIRVNRVAPDVLDRDSRGGVHQGVVADVRDVKEHSVGELVRGAEGVPLLIVLDGIEDPQNLGAILRTADAAGVDGVVLQTRHSASLGGAAAKASAGAVAHVRIAEVVNIARALDELKELGVWTVGFAGEATTPYGSIDFSLPTALVLGAEGTGMRRLVREKCDVLTSIPMRGHVGSLNVSVAAGVALFEAVRQRSLR
jgi:23S rRNA (guanosine2251-2'-O)-methyltransferase